MFKKRINPEKIKRRNTSELNSKGIKVIEFLPYLESPQFRSPEEIAKRIMLLTALFQLHLKAPNNIIEDWIKSNGLYEDLTESERKFLRVNYKELPEQDQIDIYWFVEALWAFTWIGGLHNNLTFNTPVEDSLASMLPNIKKNESAKPFISKFRLRSKYQLFNMLDKFYRAHWFARQNSLMNVSSDKVDMDLIMERRKALEFTCYSNIDWDDISLDT